MTLTVKILKNMSHLIYSYYDDTYHEHTKKQYMFHYSINDMIALKSGSGTYWVVNGSIEL